MGLDGGPSDESIDHDDVSSWQHEKDKLALGRRQGVDWLGIPKGGEFAFKNDFAAIGKHEALYYLFGGIPQVTARDLKPDDWEVSGTMASYSAGTEVAAYRDYCRSQNRSRRGRKCEENSLGPPPPPLSLGLANRPLSLERLEPGPYKEQLRMVRDETDSFHCWGTGADERQYWKKVPIATKSKLIEGELSADQLDQEEDLVGFEPEGPKDESRKVKTTHELRRFTINSHPALARAMSKMVVEGRKEEVRDLMERAIPRVVAAFERVTGRRVVGLSVHFDSDLPHWNLWHTGLERVIYRKGNGADRARYRRTALNLNSSGPGLRAWKRSQLAFQRLGKAWCVPTDAELKKAEAKAMAAQGRAPGDWVLNAEADSALEELLGEAGCRHLVDEGFTEFVANEEKRYAAGAAGKLGRADKEKLVAELRNAQLQLEKQAEELESQKLASEQSVAEAKRQAEEAVAAAEQKVVGTRRHAADLLRKAANARRATGAELGAQRLAAEASVAEEKRAADEAVAAAQQEVVDARKHAADLVRKAANARRATSAKLERVRVAGNARLREMRAENDELQSRNKYSGNLVAKFINVFMALFEFPGFKQLLGVMPQKLREAVESLRLDLEKEIAGVGYTPSRPDHAVEPEVKPEPNTPVILPDSDLSQ